MNDYLFDTNILIKHLRGDKSAIRLVSELSQSSTIYISAVTRTEVLAGMHPHEEKATLTVVKSFHLLPIEQVIADQAGRFIYQQARQGFHLSLPDALIAATAKVDNLIIVTTNVKHFAFAGIEIRPF